MVRRDKAWVDLGEAASDHEGRPEQSARPDATGRWASAGVAAQVFVVNRLILVVVSLLTGWLFLDVPGRDRSLVGLWRRWDALWYVRVATHGYVWQPPPRQSDLAFFPLYPLAIRALTRVTPLAADEAGLLVAAVAFAAALYLLHRLVARDLGPLVAERAVSYLGLFPTALFFFAAYSEALYLACSLGCVYALRLRRWWVAGLCGLAAALTRQLGVLLLVPFAVEYWEARALARAPTRGREGARADTRTRPRLADLPAGLLIPAGTLAFVAYLQLKVGNGLLFLRAQAAWARATAPPWAGAVLSLRHLASARYRIPLRALNGLDLSFLALFLLLVLVGAPRLPRSYTAYAVAVLLAVLVTPATGPRQPLALLSVSRFGVTLFPPFVALALLGRHRAADRLILGLSVALLSLFTVIFVRGQWVA